MKYDDSIVPAKSDTRLEELLLTLESTERELELLLASKSKMNGSCVDPAIVEKAEQRLKRVQLNSPSIQSSILNALSACVALLDASGNIVAVNEAWSRLALTNGLASPAFGVGQNYLEVCDRAAGECSSEASETAQGTREVLSGRKKSFSLEYPCHSPEAKRWFKLIITPFLEEGKIGAVVMHVDITERMLTEEALRSSESRFRTIVESEPECVKLVSADGRLLDMNPAGLQMIEVDKAETVLGQPVLHLVHPEDRTAFSHLHSRAIRGETGQLQFRIIGLKGTERWMETHSTPLRGPDGTIASVLSVTRDFTARRKAEELLRASQASMATAQRLAHFGSWELEITESSKVDANPLRWSDEMFRIAGFEPGKVQVSNDLFFSLVPSQEHEMIRQSMASAIRDRKQYSSVHRLIRPNGEERVVQELAKIFFDEKTGLPTRIVGTAHDITEQRKAQEELSQSQALLTMASGIGRLGAWSIDLPSLRVRWSEEVLAIHELPADYAPEFKTSLDFYVPASREAIRGALNDCMHEGIPFDLELQLTNAANRTLWVRSIGEAVRSAGGTISRVQGAFQDISDRKESEQELARINRALKMLSNCHEVLIRAENENELLKQICQIVVETGGYRMAWVGYANANAEASIEPKAHAGEEHGYLSEVKLTWSEKEPTGRGPAGKTVREGAVSVCENITEDTDAFFFQKAARERGYRSVITLPLRDDERTFGLLALYSAEINQAGADEIKLLQELADDLAFGILNLRSRLDRKRIQTAVLKVAAGVSAATGIEFFEQLARNMADALGAQAGFVARLLPQEPLRARTIAAVVNGEVIENFEYVVEGTPCQGLLNVDSCVEPHDVANKFPNAVGLQNFKAQGYVGHRLKSSSGQPLGLLFVTFQEPLTQFEFITSTLQIFAARAASELERQDTDLQVREQAALLDIAHEAIQVHDMDGHIIYWNKGAERLYGWRDAEILGQASPTLHYKNPAKFQEAYAAVLQKGEWQGEVVKRTKQGKEVIVDARWTLVRDAQGHAKSILSLNIDITEKKKLESQFLRAQRMESIGTLAGGIAHDLNNVLAPIMMSLELLRDMAQQEKDLLLIDTLQESAVRGSELVRQVLSFARGVEGQRISVNPFHIMQDLLKVIRDTFPKSIDVRFTPKKDIWSITGDPTQMHQVFLNLCVNSRDAMPSGGKFTIEMENVVVDDVFAGLNPEAKPGSYVLVKVEDSGSGIPLEIRDRVFEPFFTTKEMGKGTGLGLSTTLAIVKSHGGFITVQSELGQGTQFKVYLPADAQKSTAVVATVETSNLPRGNGECVLVVDDEEAVRKIAKRTMERFGYRVLLAANGREALEIYIEKRSDISVILTDMAMPIMDGPALIMAVRAINPKVRIIGSSGLTGVDEVSKAAGPVEHYIPKPYTAELILETLKKALAN